MLPLLFGSIGSGRPQEAMINQPYRLFKEPHCSTVGSVRRELFGLLGPSVTSAMPLLAANEYV